MCSNFPNIRITEGNNFSIILPLLSRTYVATRPIDEEIDPERLQNVVVTFGGVPYQVQLTERGVQINLPATLAVGTYNILLTAEYLGSSIRAAYESAVTIVPWSEQSTAEQYIAGSPIVLRAAYVLSGAMTDAELEALKEEYREKNAQLDQAIAYAEAAKREWEEKAADLDGVAQQGDNHEATNTAILEAVQQGGGTDIAQESTSQEILAGVEQIINTSMITPTFDGLVFADGFIPKSVADVLAHTDKVTEIHDNKVTEFSMERAFQNLYNHYPNIRVVEFTELSIISPMPSCFSSSSYREVYLPKLVNSTASLIYGSDNLRVFHVPLVQNTLELFGGFFGCDATYLIDVMIGRGFTTSQPKMAFWKPTYILNSPTQNDMVTDLVDEFGDPITNNLEQLLYNIRRHIAALLPTDVGNLSISFYANLKAAILADNKTLNAFPANWTIA